MSYECTWSPPCAQESRGRARRASYLLLGSRCQLILYPSPVMHHISAISCTPLLPDIKSGLAWRRGWSNVGMKPTKICSFWGRNPKNSLNATFKLYLNSCGTIYGLHCKKNHLCAPLQFDKRLRAGFWPSTEYNERADTILVLKCMSSGCIYMHGGI